MKAALVAVVALLSASAGTAFAADKPFAIVAETEGSVMVNLGETYVAAKPGTALRAGDRVMVFDGARAKLEFADGCPLPLVANSIATVPQASPCAGAVADVQTHGPMYAQAVGSTATTTTTQETTTTTTTTTTEDDDDDEGVLVSPTRDAGMAAAQAERRRRLAWWFVGGAVAALIICDQAFDCFDGDASR